MAHSQPTIQSFYQRETPSRVLRSSPAPAQSTIKPGDGFTEEELADATDPMTRKWNPTGEYEEQDIAALIRGPKAVMIVGRIVNFTEILGKTASQPKARGWHNMLVRDDTGALRVKLYFSNKSYPFTIGHLVSIWTTFISDATAINPTVSKVPDAPLATSIFPGRDTSVHIMVHLNSDTGELFRSPLGCQGTRPLPGLMTLKNFLEGGHEVDNCKILVCVKSVGPRKTISMKSGATNDLVEIHIYDDTESTKLNLWGVLTSVGKSWIPNSTILLISSPLYKLGISSRWGAVSLTNTSMIDLNPRFRDADWLRNYVASLAKRECLKQEFPVDLWDMEMVMGTGMRIVYSLAEIDGVIRGNPQRPQTGFASLTLQSLNLLLLRSRNMLLLSEHCGVPLYGSTSLTSTCKNCNETVTLSLNPKVIGNLVDESGCIGSGKLLWCDAAWEDLFGRSVGALVGMGVGELRLLEQRMRGLRFTFVWGWSETVGKLAVLAVRE